MGDNLLEGQVKNSRKRRDRAMAEMQSPSLLYRPELVRQIFTVKPVDGAFLEEGEVLLAVRTGGGASIDVTRDYDRIGVVEGEGARVLEKALIDTGVARLKISEVLSLSGAGRAEIVME